MSGLPNRTCSTKKCARRLRLHIDPLEDRIEPSSIWGESAPANVSFTNDADPVEIGVKFRSDTPGYITGLRFFKSPTKSGIHIGDLWTNSGELLASAQYTGETASGWQTVSFDSPVAITADTTYVASYFSASGRYSYTSAYFAASGADNSPLHALAAGIDGPNGVYSYGPAGSFPTNSSNSNNYWVDVVFNTAPVDPTLPTVVPGFPAANAVDVNPQTTVTAVFNKSVVASSIVFTLSDANNQVVPATLTYDDATNTATLSPLAPLAKLTSYTATVSAAQDIYGNELASPRTWAFATGDPVTRGLWSQPVDWPLVAINTVLLNSGKVLMWDGGPDCIGSPSARVWDPATGLFTAVPVDDRNDTNDIFCSGMVSLSDGRILVVGGHACYAGAVGIPTVNIFDPNTEQWSVGADMTYPRWYPTATTLGSGQVLVTSGAGKIETSFVRVPELYDPNSNSWVTLSQAGNYVPSYPFMYQLPDGRILSAGSGEFDAAVGPVAPSRVLDLKSQTWTTVDATPVSGSSSVMYLPGKIMSSGSPYDAIWGSREQSSAATYVLDMTAASPAWQRTQDMPVGRAYDTLTMLPTGDVLTTSGSTIQHPGDLDFAVKSAASWDPDTQTWATLATGNIPRIYHSTALLLPDGRVVVAGSGRNPGKAEADETNAEIFSPAYLFKGPRPVISAAPAGTSYAAEFLVESPDTADIASMALVRVGATTHSLNMDQRYVPLSFTKTANGLVAQAPADGNTAPPGYYMLFLVNGNGVPSVASFIQLTSPQVLATTPSFGAKGIGIATQVSVTFTGRMNPATINANTVQLLDPTGNPVDATVNYDELTNTATLTPTKALSGSTNYSILVRGNAGPSRVLGVTGAPLSADHIASFQTAHLPGSGPFSLWSSSATPWQTSVDDSNAVELGVRFRADVDGYITGIRFYKGAGNTGTHLGHLWASTGEPLAAVTFVGESASGWQTALFDTPVAIKANTTYIASYYAPAGHYAADVQFHTARVDSGPLHTLAELVDGKNGLYKYGASGFPTSVSESATNYWVDVVFATSLGQHSIWADADTPAVASANDSNPVEVGVKFRSDVSGYVTGVRFYKGSANTGAHSGRLWTSSGQLLATLDFNNESATGWQQASFAAPVSINANTNYVVSYFAPVGGYAYTPAYFANSGVENAPLYALANSDSVNGVYFYGSSGGFPHYSFNANNYWVDVVFSTAAPPGGAWTQTSSADFATGTNSGTAVTGAGGGAVKELAAEALLDGFAGDSLNSSWSADSWSSQGGGATDVTVANSILSIRAAQVLSNATYSTGTGINVRAALAAMPAQHIGLTTGFASAGGNSWAIFSTKQSTNTLFARVNANGTTQDVDLGALPTGFHDYQIVPDFDGFKFIVDGALRTTINLPVAATLRWRLAFSDFQGNAAAPLQIDSISLFEYAPSATFVSQVYDAGVSVDWGIVSWTAALPTGTNLKVRIRTSVDGVNWTSYVPVTNGEIIGANSQFIQYEVVFETAEATVAATLFDIAFNWD